MHNNLDAWILKVRIVVVVFLDSVVVHLVRVVDVVLVLISIPLGTLQKRHYIPASE